jgi:hypothetical protein
LGCLFYYFCQVLTIIPGSPNGFKDPEPVSYKNRSTLSHCLLLRELGIRVGACCCLHGEEEVMELQGVCAYYQDILDSKATHPILPTSPSSPSSSSRSSRSSIRSPQPVSDCLPKFYPIYREQNGTVSLGEWYEEPPTDVIIDLRVLFKKY